jgi:hypothetical protein
MNGRGETTSHVGGPTPERGFLGVLRATAMIALLAGAVASVGLMLRAGRHAPRFLVALFAIWVLSPFIVLAWANVVSKSWPVLTRATLYGVMLALTLGSVATYGADAVRPPRAQAAFVWVIVPPASWVLSASVVGIAALIARRRSRRGHDV